MEQSGPSGGPVSRRLGGGGEKSRVPNRGNRSTLRPDPPPPRSGETWLQAQGQGRAKLGEVGLASWSSHSDGTLSTARLQGRLTVWFPPTHLHPHSTLTLFPRPGPGHWVSHSHIPASIAHADVTPRLALAATRSVATHSVSGLAVGGSLPLTQGLGGLQLAAAPLAATAPWRCLSSGG